MKQRNPVAVFFFGFLTGGIYSWYWLVKTKEEMNSKGESIPTAWMWLIPFIGVFWWYWEYSKGVEHVTNNKISGVLAFVLLALLGYVGQTIIQDYFNKISETTNPINPIQPNQPIQSQPFQAQTMQSQPVQAQAMQDQPFQAQPMQSQPVQAQEIVTPQPISDMVSPTDPNSLV